MAKDNSGSLSQNPKKEKDTHPDMKGKITIDGKLYWLSGWNRTNDSGDWISLSATLANAAPQGQAKKPAAPTQGKPFDDEIPF